MNFTLLTFCLLKAISVFASPINFKKSLIYRQKHFIIVPENVRNAAKMGNQVIHATTVLGVLHNGSVSIGADGQATMGNTVAKSNVQKVRKLQNGKILAGFAGSTADAFTLLEKFEEKLNAFGGNMKRGAIELAKDWRTDRYLRKLEAMLIVASSTEILIISGTGDVLEPENGIAAIGSGGNYALSAANALKKHAGHLSARDIVREGLTIAADLCIYTNHNFVIEELA